MKKLFSFSKKKQSPSRTADRGNALCVGYDVKEKDLGKFHKAAWRGDVAKLEHLLKNNDVNQIDKHNRTALHLACACGNAEVVRFLVEKKAKLNLCDNQHRSALMKAVQGQHDMCANILLENHTDPNLVDTEGNTALHFASSIPSISTVSTLVDHDADLNAQNKEGISPLSAAVQEDHIEVAEILLKKDADVNILDRDQRSSLMIAAGNGHISMVRLLLRFHADISLKDNKGHSAEDYAVIEGHHPCAILITEHGAQKKQAASPSHPSQKKPKAKLGSASRALESGLSVGGPATDKEDFEENSQAESLSRVSKKGGTDEWASSEDDCESISVEKTPPKMNLRKMLESKRGQVLDKSMSASESDSDNSAARVVSSKPATPPLEPASPAPFLPGAFHMTSTHPLIHSKRLSEPVEGNRGTIEQLSGSGSSSESQASSSDGSEEEEESEDDSCLASVQSNTSSSEDAQKPPLVEVDLESGKGENKQSCDGLPSSDNSSQASGTSPMLPSLAVDQDLLVSAIRVESKYSDEDEEFMSAPGQKVISDLIARLGTQMANQDAAEDGVSKNDKRRSSWGSSFEETDGCEENDDITDKTACPKIGKATSPGGPKTTADEQKLLDEMSPRSKNRPSAGQSDWDSPSENAGRNEKATSEEHLVEASLASDEKGRPESRSENATKKRVRPSKHSELSEKGEDRVARHNPSAKSPNWSDKMLEEENCTKVSTDGGQTSARASHPRTEVDADAAHSDGFSQALPHADIDHVDLDSPLEKEEDEIDASDDEEDEEGEEEEEEEDISDDQLEENGGLLDVTTAVPEKRDVSKDAKSGVFSELGLEKEEEEAESWDSQHEDHALPHEDQQSAQAQTTAGEKMQDGLGAVAENKDGVDVHKEDQTEKESATTKWGLLLSKCEGKSKEKTDLMEELGLGEFDYAEDASDWDTSSNVSKKSLPGGLEMSPAPKEFPQSSSKSPKTPVAPPRRMGADEKRLPAPRSNKTLPPQSGKSDWDQDNSAWSCTAVSIDNRQRQEALREGYPDVSTVVEDKRSHLQADKQQEEENDDAFDLASSHPYASSMTGDNVVRHQQSPAGKEAKSTLAFEGQFKAESFTDEKQANSTSAEEQSSHEEEGEAFLRPTVPARKLAQLSVPEEEKRLNSAGHSQPSHEAEKNPRELADSRPRLLSRHSASFPDVDKLKQEAQKEVVQQTPEAVTNGSALSGTGAESQVSLQRTCDVSKAEEQAVGMPSQPAGGSSAPQPDISLFDDSTLSDVSHDEARSKTGQHRKKTQLEEIEMSENIDELNSSSDATTDESDIGASGHRWSSLVIHNLDSLVTDSRSMVQLQNIFHKYERSIQKAKSRGGFFADKASLLESEKTQLRISLDELKDAKSALERHRLDLQTQVRNLEFQLKQDQEKGRNAGMMCKASGDKLRRTEEQLELELEERHKVELALCNLQMDMRILANHNKQLEEDNGQSQTLLAQERSARAVLENLLGSHVRKQQDIQEESQRNRSKSQEALSQLTEASDRERELLQQISIFHQQLSTLRTDLESSQANSSIKQRDLQEENKALKEQLREARRALQADGDTLSQTVLDLNKQMAGVKSELSAAAARLEKERQSRESAEAESESLGARLDAALREAERCMAARSDAEKALLREEEELRRLKDRLASDASGQHEAVGILSQKLSKAEAHANSLENDAHGLTLQLSEKNLLLSAAQRDGEQRAARVGQLEAALQAEKELLARAAARQEAARERLARAQSEGLLLRQQLEEAQNKGATKDRAVTDAQKSFGDILDKLRSDCEGRVRLVQDRNEEMAAKVAELREHVQRSHQEKLEREASQRQLQQELADSLKKLSMCEASLEVNTRYRNDLEEEKNRLIKDTHSLKQKMEERESQCLKVEQHASDLRRRLDESEKELSAATQKQQEALSAATAADAVVRQLEDAVQRLEIENVKLEAAAKQQSNKLEALQKGSQEEAGVRAHLEDLVRKLQSSQMTLEEQLDKEKQSASSHSAREGSQAMWEEEERKSRSKLGLRLAEIQKEKGQLDNQVEIEKKKAKKVAERKKAVDCRLEQEMVRNTQLQKEMYRLRTLLKSAKKRLRDQDAGAGGAGSDFASPLSSLKMDLARHSRADGAFDGRREKLERGEFQGSLPERRRLEEEVLNLKRRVEASETEHGQMEQYRRELEEKARQELHHKLQEVNIFLQSQAASQEAQDHMKAATEASLRLKIQELESEVSRARASQHDTVGQRESARAELQRVKELYREEQNLRKSMSVHLKRTTRQLTETGPGLLGERGAALVASPGPSSPASGGVASLYGGVASRLLGSAAEGQSGSVDDYLTMMQRQLDRSISRELNKASAELDVSLARMSPVGSASRVDLDPVSRAKQQYLEVLKKNHEV